MGIAISTFWGQCHQDSNSSEAADSRHPDADDSIRIKRPPLEKGGRPKAGGWIRLAEAGSAKQTEVSYWKRRRLDLP